MFVVVDASIAIGRIDESRNKLGLDTTEYLSRALGTYLHMFGHASSNENWAYSDEHFSGEKVDVTSETPPDDIGLALRVGLTDNTLGVIDNVILKNSPIRKVVGVKYNEILRRAFGVYEALVNENVVKRGGTLSVRNLQILIMGTEFKKQ